MFLNNVCIQQITWTKYAAYTSESDGHGQIEFPMGYWLETWTKVQWVGPVKQSKSSVAGFWVK